MGSLGAPAPVNQPPVSKAPHGLLSTADEARDPAGTRWMPGFEFQPRFCGLGGVWVPCADFVPRNLGLGGDGSGSGEQTKPDEDSNGIVRFIPYVVWDQFTCSSRGFEVAEYQDTARASIELTQDKQIEYEFWTGAAMTAAGNDALGDPIENMSLMATTPAGGVLNPGWDGGAGVPQAVSPKHGLALLQQGLANCGPGTRGMIHATPYLADLWGMDTYIADSGGRLTTMTRGTLVVSGAGYTGEGPDIVPALTPPAGSRYVWAYATGLPEWRLSEVQLVPLTPDGRNFADNLRSAIDRKNNRVTFRSERFAAAVWNTCCTIAVLIDLCADGCNTSTPGSSGS